MQQNHLFSVLQLNGFLFTGGAGKGKPWRETGHLGGPIQNRYKTDMKVEFAVQIFAKPIQEKKLVGGRSALQQYPRLIESVPNKSASSHVVCLCEVAGLEK